MAIVVKAARFALSPVRVRQKTVASRVDELGNDPNADSHPAINNRTPGIGRNRDAKARNAESGCHPDQYQSDQWCSE